MCNTKLPVDRLWLVMCALVALLGRGAPCWGAISLKSGDRKPFLVVLVDTRQSKFNVTTETVAGWIFPDTKKHHTMQDWIRVNFAGKVGIEPCRESGDTKDDGVVKVAIATDDPTLEEPRTMERLCREALLEASSVLNVARYDTSRKGKIGPSDLGILFLFARPKLAGGRTTFGWAKIAVPKLNGVKVEGFEFICAPPDRDNIGAIAHDWLHLYGEVDFYARDKTRFGVADLHLGYIWKGSQRGRNGPSNLMPLSMENFGIVPPEVVARSGVYTLRAHSTGRYNYLKIPTDDPKEYFLLENRQFDGFDECLANDIKSPGVAIYHVDRKQEIKGNFNNDDRNHRLVTIEAANEAKMGFNEYNVPRERYRNADHDVLWHEEMSFGPSTVPNSHLYSGQPSGISVKVLDTNGPEIRVRVMR